jgi:hypothetical protein
LFILKITEVAQFLVQLFSMEKVMNKCLQNTAWAAFRAIFSQTPLVTLTAANSFFSCSKIPPLKTARSEFFPHENFFPLASAFTNQIFELGS